MKLRLFADLDYLTSMEFFSSFFNDVIGNAVLCVACVLMLSYLREVPPKFEGKRMVGAGVVLSAGAFISRFNAHFLSPHAELNEPPLIQQALSHYIYNMRFADLTDEEKISLFTEISSSVIGIVSICAGAFILMRMFRAKHIAPMIIVQAIGFLLKEIFKNPYKNMVKLIMAGFGYKSSDELLYGYNGFAYGFFMIIMIILYILFTRHMFENFWTKNVSVVKHIFSLAGLFAAYTLFIIVIDIFVGKYGIKEEDVIFKLMINIFLAAALLLVPRRTYEITRGELQNEFYEVERKEKVELYEYSQTQSKAIRKYIHDLPMHFRAVDDMAAKIGAEEISQYINEMSNDLIEAKCQFSTGNAYLDDLLVTELKNAQKNNTNIIFTGAFPNDGIKRKDLTTIFMNLIENAIEASSKVSGKREILISSKIVDDRVFVTFSNQFEHGPKKRRGKIETTKRNKDFHGYGMSNVANVVEKREYDGTFSTEHKDNIFTASIDMKFRQ